MLRRVKVWFVPPEAHQIAAQFEQQAASIRVQAQQLQQVQATLSQDWKGNSANQFQDEIAPKIKDLQNFANWLSEKANEIRNKQVYRWEWK